MKKNKTELYTFITPHTEFQMGCKFVFITRKIYRLFPVIRGGEAGAAAH